MTAGRRDTLITIERATSTQDAYGEETATWSELCREWACIIWGRGDERRQAAMEQGSQAATFQCLANMDTLAVTIRDRITADGATWDIVGIAKPVKGEVEFSAVRAA